MKIVTAYTSVSLQLLPAVSRLGSGPSKLHLPTLTLISAQTPSSFFPLSPLSSGFPKLVAFFLEQLEWKIIIIP